MTENQFRILMAAVERLTEKADEMRDTVAELGKTVAVMEEKISHFVTIPELFNAIQDRCSKCPSKKPSSSAIMRPNIDGDRAKVTWGSILKYTSIIFTAIGLGFTVAKFVL